MALKCQTHLIISVFYKITVFPLSKNQLIYLDFIKAFVVQPHGKFIN